MKAGVEFEEAAGKHRAGDAIKSLRFFERAINTYEEGLTRFPESFDLAYNKARVQYEVATHPKLAKQLQQPLLDLLRVALASHEFALKLNEKDADLLFNTSQVLTSIAEEHANGGLTDAAIGLLKSAMHLQAGCLTVQELTYAETLQQEREAREVFEARLTGDNGGEEMQDDDLSDANSTKPGEEGQWASVLEPVTADTLTDTIIACFGTMTTLCTTINTSRYFNWQGPMIDIERQSARLMEKAQGLNSLPDTEKLQEFSLADAILQSALLDAAFALGDMVSAAAYKSRLEELWDATRPQLNLKSSVEALIAHANALVSFNFSLSMKQQHSDIGLLTDFRWAALASAIKSLTTASNIVSISQEVKAKTHLLRGDASLLQFRMSTGSVIHKQAATNAATLLKNAEVFYKNAAQLSSEPEDKDRALFRCIVVQHLVKGDFDGARAPAWDEELQIMMDEGLAPERT